MTSLMNRSEAVLKSLGSLDAEIIDAGVFRINGTPDLLVCETPRGISVKAYGETERRPNALLDSFKVEIQNSDVEKIAQTIIATNRKMSEKHRVHFSRLETTRARLCSGLKEIMGKEFNWSYEEEIFFGTVRQARGFFVRCE